MWLQTQTYGVDSTRFDGSVHIFLKKETVTMAATTIIQSIYRIDRKKDTAKKKQYPSIQNSHLKRLVVV